MIGDILDIAAKDLEEYSKISIAFEVKSIYEVKLIDNGLGGIKLIETEVDPHVKDYDEIEEGNKPIDWSNEFDITNWGLFLIYDDSIPIAGATVAFDTSNIGMLHGKKDRAMLWDLRVHPDYRRLGLGKKLFQKIKEWSKNKGCNRLIIDTQNSNVPACKFYVQQGCQLGEINRFKYIDNPKIKDEVMLVWYLSL